jgi:hypothetical protein
MNGERQAADRGVANRDVVARVLAPVLGRIADLVSVRQDV